MMAPLTLALFAVLVNSVGSRLLYGARWTRRSPGLGILMWQALTVSVVMAGVLVGLALVFPSLPASASVANLIEACSSALREKYQTPGGQTLGIAGGIVTLALVTRAAFCGIAAWRTMYVNRSAQHQHLDLASRRDPMLGISVVEHSTAAAYCIPGRRARIVFTSAAMARLDASEVSAVIAHERAHLRGRHDLVLVLFGALRSAFPGLASMRLAQSEVAQLLEMRADDRALRSTDRFTLAKALVGLSQSPVPAGAVAATGSAIARLSRFAEPPRPFRWIGGLFVCTTVVLLLIAPVAIVIEPAASAAFMAYCPI